ASLAGSTGAWLMSAFHQLSAGNSGRGAGNGPASCAPCPNADPASVTSAMPVSSTLCVRASTRFPSRERYRHLAAPASGVGRSDRRRRHVVALPGDDGARGPVHYLIHRAVAVHPDGILGYLE